MTTPSSAVAIVGMGCRFPGSPSIPAFWRTVRDGHVWTGPVPRSRWNHDLFYSATRGDREHNKTYVNRLSLIEEPDLFAPDAYGIAPRRARLMDPQQRLFLDVVRGALEDAGYAQRALPRDRVGTFVGACMSDFMSLVTVRMRATLLGGGEFGDALPGPDPHTALTKNVVPLAAHTVVGSLLNMIAANVNQSFDFGGPAFTTDAACSSALVALNEAILHLRHGQIDVALVGGVYMVLSPDNVLGFARIGAVSPSNICRPFDQRADGFVVGEGLGAVVCKRLSDAIRDGDRVYAVIRGMGINNDGKGDGPMTPRKEGQVAVLDRAYTDAGVNPDTVELLEGHGTATPVGDATEIAALAQFRSRTNALPAALSSAKANIGHSMSAAGIAGLIRAALCVHHHRFAKHAGYKVPRADPNLDGGRLYIPTETKAWARPASHLRRAGVNSFGFGGTNCHVVLEEFSRDSEAAETARVFVPSAAATVPPQPELFLLSAPTRELLAATAQDILDTVSDEDAPDMTAIAYSLALRTPREVRAAFVARTREQLATQLAELACPSTTASASLFIAEPAAQPLPVAFLFAGQGAQRPDLARELYERFPSFRAELERLTHNVAVDERPLLSFLYPRNGARSGAKGALARTEICQPIMAALGLAMASWLSRLGIAAKAVAGHSLGEFAAGAYAGVLDPGEAVHLVASRGALIASLPLADNGAMAAISASRAEVQDTTKDIQDLVIANVNHPRQVVIAGASEAVMQACAALTSRNINSKVLDVSHAFHSRFMDGIRAPFAQVLAAQALHAPTLPILSSVVSTAFPAAPDDIRALWTDHATSPVDFVSAVRGLHDLGMRVFVQLGGGRSLVNMARQTLSAQNIDCSFLALTDDEGLDATACLHSFARLFTLGADLDAGLLFEGRGLAPVSLPPSRLKTRSFWPVKKDAENTPLASDAFTPSAAPQMTIKSPSLPVDLIDSGSKSENLTSLFAQQMAVLAAQALIIRQQNDLLLAAAPGAGSVKLAVATPAASNPPQTAVQAALTVQVPVASVPARDVHQDVSHDVRAAVSRITATPVEHLNAQTRLGADLGFDSLMVTELNAALLETFPRLALPRSLFSSDLTLGLLTKEVAAQVGAVPAAPTLPAAVKFFRPGWKLSAPRDLSVRPADNASVVIQGDHQGLALALQQALETMGRHVVMADAEPDAVPSSAHVIDLSMLDNELDADVSASLLAVMADMQERASVRPVSWRVLRSASAPQGVQGLIRSLGQEWPDVALACIEVQEDLLDPAHHDQLVPWLIQNLADGEANLECHVMRNGAGTVERHDPTFDVLPMPAAVQPFEGAIVISGGTGSIGLKLAESLATGGARVGLLGRKPAQAASVVAVLQNLRAKGATVQYRACDMRDAASVRAAIAGLTSALGPLQACVHAAGVTNDQAFEKIDKKSAAAVVETKVQGALALWQALQTSPLQTFVAIGSWAGRFGNVHQSAYAMANAALGSLVAGFAAERNEARCCVLELPAWRGTEMVEALPQAVRVNLTAQALTIGDAEGLRVLNAALSAPELTGTLVVGGKLPGREFHFSWVQTLRADAPAYLADHIIAARPVLPLAGAVDIMMTSLPQQTWPLVLRDITVVDGVVLEGPSAKVRLHKRQSTALTRLELTRIDGRKRIAFRASVQNESEPLDVAVLQVRPSDVQPPTLDLARFYQESTFHGPGLRPITTVTGVGSHGIVGELLALKVEGGTPFVAALDGVLQLFGFWSTHNTGRGGLPLGISSLVIHRMPRAGERLKVTAAVATAESGTLQGEADATDESGALVFQVRGFSAEPRELSKVANLRVASKALDLRMLDTTLDLPVAHTQVDHFPEVKELSQRIAGAKSAGMKIPYFRTHDGINAATASVDGRALVNFSSYNYLGFSGHPEVTNASKLAIDTYGTSVSASRIASGERPLHHELEAALAQLLGSEDALVMVGGHATNLSVIGHLLGPEDLVVHDSLAHDSILGGARLSGAKRRPFAHNDVNALEKILRETRHSVRRVLIAVEGVYSMDGDMAPLDRIVRLKRQYGALLLVDEAHSIGVLGPRGGGIGEHFGVNRTDVDLWMGTLSKTFASCGGYVTGTRKLIEYLRYTVPGFIYSVGISPPNAAAALAAIRLMREQPGTVLRLQDRSRFFLNLCRDLGINTGMSQGSAVIPCIVGSSMLCMQLSEALLARGFNVQPILYPAVEEDQARLRFFISATHTEEQLRHAATVLAEELARLQPLRQVAHPARTLANGG